jgi:hypothetical protein
MALKKNITLKNNFGDDVTFVDSYIKIEKLAGGKEQLGINVSFYKKQNEQIVDSKNYLFTPSLEGKNFISQAYDHLRTLPEFAGATDC